MRLYLIPAFIIALNKLPIKTQLQYNTISIIHRSLKSDENHPNLSKQNAANGIGSPSAEANRNVKQVLLQPNFNTFRRRSNEKNLNNHEIRYKNKLEGKFVGNAKNESVDTMNIQQLEGIVDVPVSPNRYKDHSDIRKENYLIYKKGTYSDSGKGTDTNSAKNNDNNSKKKILFKSIENTDSVPRKADSRKNIDAGCLKNKDSGCKNKVNSYSRKDADSNRRRKIYSDSRQEKLFEVYTDNENVQKVTVTDRITGMNATKPINENVITNEGIIMEGINELSGQTAVDDILIRGARHRRNVHVKDSKEEEKQNASNISDIAETAIELCPFVDFCYLNATDSLYENEASCCKSCHCDANCGKRLDCCFKDLDKYQVVTTNQMECITPKISVLNESTIYSRDFYMIQECLSNTKNNCKNKTAASWGSFFPVYSRESDKIYFNKHCAECNHVYDSIYWSVSLFCMVDFEPALMNDLLLEALDEGACEILFIPPDDKGIEKFSCYKNTVHTCNVTEKWAKDDPVIRKACEKVYAPVNDNDIEGLLYANVFCKICNGQSHLAFQTCPVYEHHQPKEPETSFSVLLDVEVVNAAMKQSDITRIEDLRDGGVCGKFQLKDPYKNECRVILCPSGYLRTPDGCQIYSPTWYLGYKVFITLKTIPQNLLPLSEALSLSHNQIIHLLGMKGLPTDMFILLAEARHGEQNVDYVRQFKMVVGTEEFPTDSVRVLDSVKTALEQHWEIVLNDKTYIYKASHSRNTEPQFFGTFGNNRLTFITAAGSFAPNFLINKLYFCEQIELRPDEWRPTNGSEISLIGGEKDTILFSLEYNMRRDENGESRVQICLDDFKLHYNLEGISNSVRLKLNKILLSFLLMYCFYKFRSTYK